MKRCKSSITQDKLETALESDMLYLKLPFINDHYKTIADEAAAKHWSHIEYLERLIQGETEQRRDRATKRRITAAHFPVIKTHDNFRWTWPKKINRLQVQNLFRLSFINDNSNVIFLGSVGLGKTHLATALGYVACLSGYHVLFATAIDVINSLCAAKAAQRLQGELKKYIKPSLLILDELGYLPIDKAGSDLLFQVISHRYERGSLIITSNRVFKEWPKIFNNDSTLTSAILDRLLHHAETVVIEGKSYRMKDRIEA
ncbi:MAG: ATP-binding protein [Candidatus Scalindua sp. AMX11]|nr:ATP-binding protein [Planctomycetota bacterium]RZV60697.1 MAG: ATP-binding protein [Candidatus Scalindua sp. SCAELEC01]TDE63131.1 MAG: ATP-binding protein [Candidatus Scalindua sp. AMX11]GJQ60941.1 MAG: ATP-binding protein [Candidatus Scalindua sp.]NOG83000.1 ATP-binding protein [Planctomycetota bacterium]